MTPDRWARMSWHARERHAAALRREAQRLDARLAGRQRLQSCMGDRKIDGDHLQADSLDLSCQRLPGRLREAA